MNRRFSIGSVITSRCLWRCAGGFPTSPRGVERNERDRREEFRETSLNKRDPEGHRRLSRDLTERDRISAKKIFGGHRKGG